eukprot:TRINITY_DN38493_c0_g1_i1.p1 TRINITY_DN38493_c0_g1~~TRINITY_DN38493_c0_g1_i1.p1  ORF type:complete len:392 (+),score=48.86 TRINITY_DN38493_c0_g1_i1:60-1178(+)
MASPLTEVEEVPEENAGIVMNKSLAPAFFNRTSACEESSDALRFVQCGRNSVTSNRSQSTFCATSTAHDSRIDPLHGLRRDSLQVLPDSFSNQYERICSLGVGGFGTVELFHLYEATEERFAVKTIRVASVTDTNAFEKELRISEVLNHPCIVRLHAVFHDKDVYRLVMDYCEGGDLLNYINKECNSNDSKTCVSFLYQMLSGLAYLHHYGMAHRDLKPENYMLQDNRSVHPVIKLIDFGASRTANGDDGVMTSQVGTWMYAAPEVIRSEPYRKSCDIWSLGCTLFALCSHELPYDVPDADSLFDRLDEGATPNWEAKRWKIHQTKVKEIVKAMVQVDPFDRPSAKQVMEEHSWLRLHSVRTSSHKGCCSMQ